MMVPVWLDRPHVGWRDVLRCQRDRQHV